MQALYAHEDYGVGFCCNATSALTAALVAMGVKGKVILPTFTFPATLHSVLQSGCDVVLADVDPVTWELSAATLQAAFDDHPDARAVVPVRAFGFRRDHESLFRKAEALGLKVIEDSAAGLGGAKGQAASAIGSAHGHIEVFSFHVTKAFGIGEGGAVFLPKQQLKTFESVINFGLAPDRSFSDGMNAKLDEVHSAIGLARLQAISGEIEKREVLAASYYDALGNVEGVVLPHERETCSPWQSFPVLMPTLEERDSVYEFCGANGVGLRKYYSPSIGTGYTGQNMDRLHRRPTPVSDSLADCMVCLPIYPNLSASEQRRVVDTFVEGLKLSRERGLANGTDRIAAQNR